MLIGQVFSGESLKAADLQGREFTLCIAAVELKKFDNGNKIMLRFQNAKKVLIVNKTNAQRISRFYGEDTDGWIGKEVVLYTDLVQYQGSMVDAIRVRAPMRRPPAQAQSFDDPPPPAPAPRQVSVAGGQAIQERDSYTVSTGTERHPNAPGNNELDDPIPF
jgi:hypothetical protein